MAVTNILVGIGLLSMPYAMSLSGGAGIFLTMLCCLLFNVGGKFIAWGLDLLPENSSSHIQVRHCTIVTTSDVLAGIVQCKYCAHQGLQHCTGCICMFPVLIKAVSTYCTSTKHWVHLSILSGCGSPTSIPITQNEYVSVWLNV